MSASPSESPASTEPKVEGQGTKHLNLKVKDQHENEIFFSLKNSTRLEKMMSAYCERQGIDPGSVRFHFEGERIQKFHTPQYLGIKDEDMIQVFTTQLGGDGSNRGSAEPGPEAAAAEGGAPAAEPKPTHLNVKVKDQSDNEVFFKIKFTTPLKKVMLAYCERGGLDVRTVRFLFDGVRVNDESTPAALDMEDGDCIDVHVEQVGGWDLNMTVAYAKPSLNSWV